MEINKQQKICDVIDCYKSISFITKEFLSNKVLWTCEKHKNLLNHTKDKNQEWFYKRLENSKIIFDYKTGFLKLWFYKTT
ncbi:MAG: hypothetical protein EIB84_03360 [Spiroplasma poulsonii]|uniref:Uncharacterized protein n=1 Tax=Spiroplasma poulsonii TaxID=2138 RepID=A0A0C2I4A3_9MOLU|nr:hypothetical protein [Spiroplasma poulsonii]UXX42145.1 hypothetical protein [Spiroplasma phage MaM-2019a]KAF0850135.1 hypothetical protein MSROBK_022480 [Spiroplasma poulsonii]KAF0850247.1 hypothetical protein MSROBK_020620 [Spiroplasma poulsonii]KAF0850267.1 hypothetical protein MSROBK_018150 [Spiroplasma poulsonii]KAF0850430.1 hypothetical protein MSROBK_020060 [Spiroplasma poulsonii]